jgi:hypothetical protein
MGTRSLTVVKDQDGNKIVEIYRQFDGYPEGMGADLIDFIESGELVNGISMEDQRQFNGVHCFAAQLISHLKGDQAGGIYLYSPTHDYKNKKQYWKKYFAEYYYEIDHELNIKCWDTIDNKEEVLHNE